MVTLINAVLDGAALHPSQPRALELAFDGLISHVTAHFGREEGLLRAAGDAGVDERAALHQSLLNQAQTLYAQFGADPEDTSALQALVKFLLAELVNVARDKSN